MMNNRRLMVTPIFLLLAVVIAWAYSNQSTESSLPEGEVMLKIWLKQQGWSYFLQASDNQCQILVSKPVPFSLAEKADDVDRACRRLLIKLQAQQSGSQDTVPLSSEVQVSD